MFACKNCVVLRKFHSTTRNILDLIGKPDKISNIRPLKCILPQNATNSEERLMKLRTDTQKWHHEFWSRHNIQFQEVKLIQFIVNAGPSHQLFRNFIFYGYNKSKEIFEKNWLRERKFSQTNKDGTKQTLDPEDMAVFHREFIRINHQRHLEYDK